MKVNCVIVTYNRISLLQECIQAVNRQANLINKIFIIDNCSVDGTKEYLELLSAQDIFEIITLPENIGGAGGFSRGIKEAVLNGCDWVWVMDDDTIPTPNALEELLKGCVVNEQVGYVCSRVVWTDGMIHKMNVPNFCSGWSGNKPLHYYTYQADVLLVKSASFVSLLLNANAVKEVGLPISEFFIWGDDLEYTQRIFNAGYTCFYADKSIVVHKTEGNYVSDLRTAPIQAAWKFYYGLRNAAFMRRSEKKNVLIYFFYLLNGYRRNKRKLSKRPNKERKVFVKILRRAFWASLSFRPTIEFLPSTHTFL